MRLKNGDLILDKVRIPLLTQPQILPLLLIHYPENYKALGMNFDTYWDFCVEARREFMNNLVRIPLYPPADKLRAIFVKDTKSPLWSFLKWVRFQTDRKDIYEWIDLLRQTFDGMDEEELVKVWKKLHSNNPQEILLKYYPDRVLPLLLQGASENIRARIEARMKS